MRQNRFSNHSKLRALVVVAAGVVGLSMLASGIWAAGENSEGADRRREYIAKMAERFKLNPDRLKPPDVSVFIENAAVLAFLEKEGIKPVGEVEHVERVVIELGGDYTIRKSMPENEVAPAGDSEKGSWRLYILEADSSEEATMVALHVADGIASALPQVGAQWEGKAIGEVSISHPYRPPGQKEQEIWGTTVFRRGNVAIAICGGTHYVGQPVVDARKLAARVDRYLLKRPDEGLTAKDKSALKKLDILMREASGAAQGPAGRVVEGKSYGLSVEGLPDEAKGKELRLYVEHGEVVRHSDGSLRATFEGEGQRRIHAYAMDADGKCVALGVKEVLVEATDN